MSPYSSHHGYTSQYSQQPAATFGAPYTYEPQPSDVTQHHVQTLAAFQNNSNIPGLGSMQLDTYGHSSGPGAHPQHLVREDLSEGEFDEYQPEVSLQGSTYNGQSYETTKLLQAPVLERPNTDKFGRTVDANRQKSPSYEPHISPIIESKSVAKSFPKKRKERHRKSGPPAIELEYDEGGAVHQKNGSTTGTMNTTMKDLIEARQRARDAILQLIPYNVQVDDYLREGIDESVVRRQMQELGVHAQAALSGFTGLTAHSSASANAPASERTRSDPQHGAKTDKEERKDRIARLMAEKKQKAMTTANPQASKAKADKEKLLRLKMEALQKSRELRAQKSSTTQASSDKSPSNSQPNQESVRPTSMQAQSNASRLAQDIDPHSAEGSLDQDPSQKELSSIPGLFLSGSNNKDNSPRSSSEKRRRPVAADFVSTSEHHMQLDDRREVEQSFVIDLSEDEEDGQLTGASSGHLSQSLAHLPGVSSIRDAPPLTDVAPRKTATSSPLAHGMPAIPANYNKVQGTPLKDLKAHENQLLELKMKIAAMEQRKLQKRSQNPSMPTTPLQTTGVSGSSSQAESVEATPRVAHSLATATNQVNKDQKALEDKVAVGLQEAIDLQHTEARQRELRRLKITEDLPLIEAQVEESRAKLTELRREMSKLEVAVETGLQTKLRLAQELRKLQTSEDDPRDLIETSERTENADATSSARLSESNTRLHDLAADHTPEVGLSDASMAGAANLVTQSSRGHVCVEEDAMDVDVATAEPPVLEIGASAEEQPEKFSGEQTLDAQLQSVSAQESNDAEMEDSFAPNPNELAPASISGGEAEADVAFLHAVSEISDDSSDDSVASPPKQVNAVNPHETGVEAILEVASAVSSPDQEPSAISAGKSPSASEDAAIATDTLALSANIPNPSKKHHFTPYESPLKLFHQFRFHPGYEKEVDGGFKSLTYSNKINPQQELCRFELAGGVCNDDKCDMQHFGKIGLADDEILVQLGNSTDYSDADRPRFVAGLRSLLQELRSKKIKDFKSIAAAIAAYRATFLQDNTRVLMLDDVTL